MQITFEPLSTKHFSLLLKWLEAPHVKTWWDKDIDWSPELIQKKYSTYVKGYKLEGGKRKEISSYIICANHNPIGYIQVYNAYDFPRTPPLTELPTNLAAFDIFIGETDYLGKGIGSGALKIFMDDICDKKYTHIFADPDIQNIAAIKAYEKAGFIAFPIFNQTNEFKGAPAQRSYLREHRRDLHSRSVMKSNSFVSLEMGNGINPIKKGDNDKVVRMIKETKNTFGRETKKMNNKNNIHVLSRAVIIDQDHILLCKTLDLQINFYFLPGGHIEHNESAQDAVLRELEEESGAKCAIKRFLGCLEHIFKPGHNSICHNHEYNLIFEVESASLQLHTPIPQMEEHLKLVWTPIAKISEIDFRPEALKTLLPKWISEDKNNAFQSMLM